MPTRPQLIACRKPWHGASETLSRIRVRPLDPLLTRNSGSEGFMVVRIFDIEDSWSFLFCSPDMCIHNGVASLSEKTAVMTNTRASPARRLELNDSLQRKRPANPNGPSGSAGPESCPDSFFPMFFVIRTYSLS